MKMIPSSFDYHEALQQADRILARPPAKAFIKRPELLPTRVFRAAIPSELCLAVNEKEGLRRIPRRKGIGVLVGIEQRLWSQLELQSAQWIRHRWRWPFQVDEPDGGEPRPQVIAIKFSSHAPDVGANFGKMAIDMLRKPTPTRGKHRMGLIIDDRPACVEQLHWWEFLPTKCHAFIVIEVRI
jgi:hypothetical protein